MSQMPAPNNEQRRAQPRTDEGAAVAASSRPARAASANRTDLPSRYDHIHSRPFPKPPTTPPPLQLSQTRQRRLKEIQDAITIPEAAAPVPKSCKTQRKRTVHIPPPPPVPPRQPPSPPPKPRLRAGFQPAKTPHTTRSKEGDGTAIPCGDRMFLGNKSGPVRDPVEIEQTNDAKAAKAAAKAAAPGIVLKAHPKWREQDESERDSGAAVAAPKSGVAVRLKESQSASRHRSRSLGSKWPPRSRSRSRELFDKGQHQTHVQLVPRQSPHNRQASPIRSNKAASSRDEYYDGDEADYGGDREASPCTRRNSDTDSEHSTLLFEPHSPIAAVAAKGAADSWMPAVTDDTEPEIIADIATQKNYNLMISLWVVSNNKSISATTVMEAALNSKCHIIILVIEEDNHRLETILVNHSLLKNDPNDVKKVSSLGTSVWAITNQRFVFSTNLLATLTKDNCHLSGVTVKLREDRTDWTIAVCKFPEDCTNIPAKIWASLSLMIHKNSVHLLGGTFGRTAPQLRQLLKGRGSGFAANQVFHDDDRRRLYVYPAYWIILAKHTEKYCGLPHVNKQLNREDTASLQHWWKLPITRDFPVEVPLPLETGMIPVDEQPTWEPAPAAVAAAAEDILNIGMVKMKKLTDEHVAKAWLFGVLQVQIFIGSSRTGHKVTPARLAKRKEQKDRKKEKGKKRRRWQRWQGAR